jgi:hypothetical protein
MGYYGSIKVSDKYGWVKSFPLEKALVMIGSASSNDIVLAEERGSGVAPLHLQVICSDKHISNLKIINLMNSPIPCVKFKTSQSILITANRAVDLEDKDQITLGDFILTLSVVNMGISLSSRTDHIGLDLEIPSLNLRKNSKLAGQICLTNFGDTSRSQFEIDLEGLPGECYQIDPAPLLFPGAKEQLDIRFFHRTTMPSAGSCPVAIRVYSPESYPTEEVRLEFNLEVDPVFEFTARVITPEDNIEDAEENILPVMEEESQAEGIAQPDNAQKPAPTVETMPDISFTESVPAESPPQIVQQLPAAGVVVPLAEPALPAEPIHKAQSRGQMRAPKPGPDKVESTVQETQTAVNLSPKKPATTRPKAPPAAETNWNTAASNLNPIKKPKAAHNLANVKILRAEPDEPSVTQPVPSDSGE